MKPILIAHVRSTREGNVFIFTLSVHRGRGGGKGYPSQDQGRVPPALTLPPWPGPGQGTPIPSPPAGTRTGYPWPTLCPCAPLPLPRGRTCHGQDTARAIRLLRFHAGGLSFFIMLNIGLSFVMSCQGLREVIFFQVRES